MAGEGVGGNYTGEVTETFVPCLDDPEFETVLCDGVAMNNGTQECGGMEERFRCSDYGGQVGKRSCALDGARACGTCPVTCSFCPICFQEGGRYYYGGVEEPHPDRYNDNYQTIGNMQRCSQGLAFCVANGYSACVSSGTCASAYCPSCASLQEAESSSAFAIPTGPEASVGACSCSEWYRGCASQVYS
mmetsp:Transcript_39335/g.98486  ORF Transcript_39335/g.98486 Transcript_39335/m.98486 type:complete len:189 (+) Transcript_39335:2-568(+)